MTYLYYELVIAKDTTNKYYGYEWMQNKLDQFGMNLLVNLLSFPP